MSRKSSVVFDWGAFDCVFWALLSGNTLKTHNHTAEPENSEKTQPLSHGAFTRNSLSTFSNVSMVNFCKLLKSSIQTPLIVLQKLLLDS